MLALIYLLAAFDADAGVVLGRVVLVIGFQVFMGGVVLLSIAAGGGGGRDEPESDDDDGRGPGRRRPPPSPPEPHVSWPDFERQFAEHVDATRARDKAPAA